MLSCPSCGEEDRLVGTSVEGTIVVTCEACRHQWERDVDPRCDSCGSGGMFRAIAAIIEKGRGTQLSVVGTRTVYLCESCDADTIRAYLDGRPNPLMPEQLPNETA